MYYPMFKNRMYENKVIRENKSVFEGGFITPIIEIIELKHDVETIIKRYDEDIVGRYFIDFFTFAYKEYLRFSPKKVTFSLDIRDEKRYKYIDLLLETVKSEKAIPIISIKQGRPFILNKEKIFETIKTLQEKKDSIAIRIEGRYYDEYFDIIHNLLRQSDYFMFDIGSSSIDSFILQLSDFSSKNHIYKTILLNSPRLENLNNGDYENEQYTQLIDNSVAKEYMEYFFDGFGDYVGLKDELPTDGGSGKGAALILMYNHEKNNFFSIVNKSTDDGLKGYENFVYERVIWHRNRLDPNEDCLAYKYIDRNIGPGKGYGNWAIWKYILMLRTLSEMKKVYK
ncbi:MAG: hypothetical protein GX931_06840 [Acholeplasmataceae bacterium]|nr:hypothetical protein [Acholeplasmataceae bacterium]